MLFGPVHGGVGVFQEIIAILVIGGIDGDADADGRKDLMAFQDEGLSDGVEDSLRQGGQPSLARYGFQQDAEFIAAHAGDGIHLPDATFQPLRHGLQELISDIAAEGIVDRLEAIQI